MSSFQRREADSTIKGFHKKRNYLLLDKLLAHYSEREQACYGRAVRMEEQVAVQGKIAVLSYSYNMLLHYTHISGQTLQMNWDRAA